jgi:hypothetical protein
MAIRFLTCCSLTILLNKPGLLLRFARHLVRVTRLIEDTDYGILEGVVYNYRAKLWFHYRKGDGGIITESSFFDILQLDLNGFL